MEQIIFGKVNEGSGDRNRLMKLVHNLEHLLKQITEGEECDHLFYNELLLPMKEAWPTVSNKFDELKNKLDKSPIEVLSYHGLTEKELQFKIAVINHAGGYFFHYLSAQVYPLANRWLIKLLEALDKFLTSLLDAVGGSGAIGEYKSFMESSIDDGISLMEGYILREVNP